MPFRKSAHEQDETEGHVRRIKAQEEPEQAESQEQDAEGHMFLPSDPGTARALAKSRSADMQREARERQRQKESRPNRR